MIRLLAALLLLAVALSAVAAEDDEEESRPAGDVCVRAVLARVECANPEEVCETVMGSRDARVSSNVEQVFDVRTQDLGDGTAGWVFEEKRGNDEYAAVRSFHFVMQGDRLVLFFDGKGRPVTYATARPKVNHRWQIERTSAAAIPGLYKKREVETWFWTGHEYAKAYSRVTFEGSKDPKLNGTQMAWNPEMRAPYEKAGVSWSYQVKPGDTLGAIAGRFGVSIEELVRQNGLRSAASLSIGQQIRYDSWRVNAR